MVLVDHTESGFASELVAFLAPHLNGAPPADDLVTKGEAAKLNSLAEKLGDGAASDTALRALVGALCKHTADLPAEDMLAAYTLMWDVINANTPDEKSTLALELVTSMVRDLVAKPADRPEARLSVLVMLYDRVGKANAAWRYDLLLALVRFISASAQLSALPSAEQVEQWLKVWGSDRAARLAVYDACCECALKLASERVAQEWLLVLLRDCEGADATLLAQHKPRALAAVGLALRSPSTFQLDQIAELAAVKQLEKDGAHAAAFKLLHVFVSGSLADYRKVEKESAPALKALGLEPAVAVRKLQLLTLVSLAHDAGGADITFATIAQATELPIEEVEELVLDAIAAGLLDARMDELRAVVRVGRCLHRTFGKAQWSKLHAELGQWRTTIQAVLEVMGTAPVAV